MSQFRSFATAQFWKLYEQLPADIQTLASEKYKLFRKDPFHPSLSFQAKGEVWTVNIGRSYRAIARRKDNASTGSGSDHTKTTTRFSSELGENKTIGDAAASGRVQSGRQHSQHFQSLVIPHRSPGCCISGTLVTRLIQSSGPGRFCGCGGTLKQLLLLQRSLNRIP